MKIEKQNNKNKGDVYNIETFNNNHNESHVNITSHLENAGLISCNDIKKSNKETLFFTGLTLLGFFADISELFPDFALPWWGWIGLVATGIILLAFRHGNAFGLSGDSLVVRSGGELLIPSTDGLLRQVSKAPCIYPNCHGFIEPINTPPNYKGPYKLLGKCSVLDRQHG